MGRQPLYLARLFGWLGLDTVYFDFDALTPGTLDPAFTNGLGFSGRSALLYHVVPRIFWRLAVVGLDFLFDTQL